MRVRISDVVVDAGRQRLVDRVGFEVPRGSFTALVGPNGSGKSTLLRAAYRAMRPDEGTVLLDEDDVWKTSAKRVATLRAVVTQSPGAGLGPGSDFTVGELVAMGRDPHRGLIARAGSRDRRIVASALEQVGLDGAEHRLLATLSGGERQRASIARALAQEAPVILLDEPGNHLDVGAQLELLELIGTLEATVLAALHDLDQAAGYADRVAMLDAGRLVAEGPALEVLTPERIQRVFGVRAAVGPHPLTGRPHVAVAGLPHSSRSTE